MRVSFKRIARTVFEASRNHKERLFSSPALAVDATPEKYKTTATCVYSIAGTMYSKAATTAIAFSAAHPIEEGKYGAILIEIDAAGTPASKISGATQTTMQSYASAALAVAALPAVTASKRKLGHIVLGANHKYATLSTNLTGNDNDLKFTAVASGIAGNDVHIEYIDPSDNDQELSIDVVGSVITVNLATDSMGAVTTTADDIKAALLLSAPASALVTAADVAANDGSGVVTAMADTALSGGTATGWTAQTDDMVAASDVASVSVVSYFGADAVVSNIGDSWVEKTPAFQEARAAEVGQYVWTGTVPTLDSSVDPGLFLTIVDSLRNRATPL